MQDEYVGWSAKNQILIDKFQIMNTVYQPQGSSRFVYVDKGARQHNRLNPAVVCAAQA